MANFDVSKGWVILFPPDIPEAIKAAKDLSRYLGLLAGSGEVPGDTGGHAPKQPALLNASGPAPAETVPVIVLSSEGSGPEQNGFCWRAGPDRVEICGESGRGLCNGIYSFLAALGISWHAPGQEKLPSAAVKDSHSFPLSNDSACEPSGYQGGSPAAAPWRRFIPAGKETLRKILKRGEIFTAWAARHRYDALILPITAFSGGTERRLEELKKFAGEYDIAIEAGGRDLSALVPRKCFFFHRDFFRMEEGRRVKLHHFCPTNPGTIRLIGAEGKKWFRAAGDIKVFHLWPDKGAETVWCSCPSCRAFTPVEQNRIGVNSAADALAGLNPGAFITYFEKAGETGNIPLRRNLFRLEKLPGEKEFHE